MQRDVHATDTRKSVAEMVAEGAREIAVLLIVFVPLDFALTERPLLTARDVRAIVVFAAVLFLFGVAIERTRR